jgi:outer membrane protein
VSSAAIAVAAALAVLQAPVTPQDGLLTLEQAIAIAEQNAFAVRVQQTAVERSRQQVAEARAQLGPRVQVGGTYTRFTEATTTQFDPNQPPIVVQPIDTRQVTASLSLPIDISGNLSRLVRAAREQEQAQRQTLRATLSDTRLNVRQAYFNVLRAEGFLGVADQARLDAQARLEQARRLFEQDQIARVDVTRFETQVAQANADVIAAENNVRLVQNQFNFVLARPIESPVRLAPITSLPAIPVSPDHLVSVAQEQRPEVLSLQDTLEALESIRRAQRAGLQPSLSASLQHQRNLGTAGFGGRAQQTFGVLNLSIPVFDSGLTRARVAQAQQDVEQVQINLEQLRLGISQEVRAALATLQTAAASLRNAEAQVALAEEVYRLAQIRQAAGVGTYIEVVDAETQLTLARNALVSARYDYLASYSQLQRAVGAEELPALTASTGAKN